MPSEIVPVAGVATGQLPVGVNELLEAWLSRRSKATKTAYLMDLSDFADWFGVSSPRAAAEGLMALGPGKANFAVLQYRNDLVARNLAAASINRRLSTLRSLVKVARLVGLVVWSLDVENVQTEPRHDRRGPNIGDVQQMARRAAQRGNGKTASRDRAIFVLLFELGLRRGELIGLDLVDVEMSPQGLPVAVRVLGKGRREKVRLTLPDSTSRVLAQWISVRGDYPGALFHRLVGHRLERETRLSGESVRLIVKALGEAAHCPGAVRPHGLRHSAITTALDCRFDIRMVQKFSRHRSIDMVVKYDDARSDVAGEIASELARRVDEGVHS
jgi:integrase/recombinase XerC